MKNQTTKFNKSKLVARGMLIIFLLTGAVSFAGCGDISPQLNTEIPNLDDGSIKYLCIGNLENSEYVNYIDYGNYHFDGGLKIDDGKSEYSVPVLNVSYGFDAQNIDKPSYSFLIGKNTGMNIWGVFYPFDGTVTNITYDHRYVYLPHHIFNHLILIYNGSQLVGKLYYRSYASLNKVWLENFIYDNLVLISVNNYTSTQTSLNSLAKEKEALGNNKNILSYLSMGNVDKTQYCSQVIDYNYSVEGGVQIEFGTKKHERIINTVFVEFEGTEAIDFSKISIEATFYEMEYLSNHIKYEFEDNGEQYIIQIFNGSTIVGKIIVSSEKNISYEWIEGFLNEGLFIVEITK